MSRRRAASLLRPTHCHAPRRPHPPCVDPPRAASRCPASRRCCHPPPRLVLLLLPLAPRAAARRTPRRRPPRALLRPLAAATVLAASTIFLFTAAGWRPADNGLPVVPSFTAGFSAVLVAVGVASSSSGSGKELSFLDENGRPDDASSSSAAVALPILLLIAAVACLVALVWFCWQILYAAALTAVRCLQAAVVEVARALVQLVCSSAHHPNSFLHARSVLSPAVFALSDFRRYHPRVASLEGCHCAIPTYGGDVRE